MTAADHANTVREALHYGHEPSCDLMHPTEGEISSRSCDCGIGAALAALDALEAQVEELEARANFADAYKYRRRAEAAEAERDRLASLRLETTIVPMLDRTENTP